MSKTVFFSWQSDTPIKTGRRFIKECIELACKEIASDAEVDEAARDLSVDSDTDGIPGQPPIVETIFKKIDSASIYVADLTFVGQRKDGRLIPNPNVLIEYGWALKSLSYERIICVMNEAYGEPSDANLPFNLKHVRWPERYNLPVKSTPKEIEIERAKLIKYFEMAIKASMATIPTQKHFAPLTFKEQKSLNGPARFRGPEVEIGFEDGFRLNSSHNKVLLANAPSIWLRVFPVNGQNRKWNITELKNFVRENVSIFIPLGFYGGSYVLAEDGFGIYNSQQGFKDTENKFYMTDSLTFIFETGEIWSVDTSLLSGGLGKLFYDPIQDAFVNGLKNYVTFLTKIGITGPLKWKAGILGAKGSTLTYSAKPGYTHWGAGPMCVSDLIEEEGLYNNEKGALTSILPFLKKIFHKCGIERPEHLGK